VNFGGQRFDGLVAIALQFAKNALIFGINCHVGSMSWDEVPILYQDWESFGNTSR
jgi:hypothetical protein